MTLHSAQHSQISRCFVSNLPNFMIQLTLEDSGSPQATNLDYNVNDETCEVIVFNDSIHVKGGVSQNIFTRSLLQILQRGWVYKLKICLFVFLSVCHHFKISGNLAFCFWGGPYGENMNSAVCPRSQNAKFQGPYGHPTDIPCQGILGGVVFKTATPSLVRCHSFAPSAKFQLPSVRSP